MSSTAELLREARALIERGWTQDVMACDKDGEEIDSCDDRAAQWCAVGAIERVTAGGAHNHYREMRVALTAARPVNKDRFTTTIGWNDHPLTTQSEVLETFDRAIAAAEGEAA